MHWDKKFHFLMKPVNTASHLDSEGIPTS